MKIKYLMVCFLWVMLSVSVQADNRTDSVAGWRSNWYIEGGLGAQILFSKDASNLSFGRRLSPSFSLTTGKWFSPYWGLRLQVQGYKFHGFSTTEGLYLNNPLSNGMIYGPNDPVRGEVTIAPDGSYRHYLYYMNVHADFQISLFNLLRGVNDKCRWDIVPAVGLGYAHFFPYRGTPKNNVLSANFSVMGKYKLTKNLDINLEVQTALMPDQFDGRITGKLYENSCAAMLGVTYRFKRKGFARKPALNYVPKEIVRIERDTVIVPKEVIVQVEKKIFNQPFTLAAIAFKIDSYNPKEGQEINYVNVVKYLENNPYAKLRLDGYADRGTGTADYNLNLSIKRAAVVRQILINHYRVDASRLQAQGIGSNGQPYEKNKWNRTVVITAIEELP